MTRSWCQEPYSAKDSRAFQAAGCSRAKTDWVMVCSSTFMTMAVIHSAKRWKPRQVKAQAKVLSKACQMDQVSLASVMTRLLCWGGWEPDPDLASSDQETLLFNTVRLFSYCTVFRGNYCLMWFRINRMRLSRGSYGSHLAESRVKGENDEDDQGALGTRGRARVALAVGVFAQGKRPADVPKEADVAKEVRHPADKDSYVRRDIGGESNGNWGWIGLLGLAGLAGLLGRYRDGANLTPGTVTPPPPPPPPPINHLKEPYFPPQPIVDI